jgi:hypothetical protein
MGGRQGPSLAVCIWLQEIDVLGLGEVGAPRMRPGAKQTFHPRCPLATVTVFPCQPAGLAWTMASHIFSNSGSSGPQLSFASLGLSYLPRSETRRWPRFREITGRRNGFAPRSQSEPWGRWGLSVGCDYASAFSLMTC